MASFFAPAPRSRPGPHHAPPLVARRPTLRNPAGRPNPFVLPTGSRRSPLREPNRRRRSDSLSLNAYQLPVSVSPGRNAQDDSLVCSPDERALPRAPSHASRDTFVGRAAPGQEQHQHQHQHQPEVLRLGVSASCCDGHGPSRNASLRRFNPTDRPSVAYEQGLRPARSYGYTVSDVTTVVLRIAATPAARRYDGNYIDAPFPRRAPLVASRTSAPLRSRRSYSSTSFRRDVPPPPLSATTFTRSLREASPLELAVRPGSRSAPVAAHGSPVSRLRSSGFGYVVA